MSRRLGFTVICLFAPITVQAHVLPEAGGFTVGLTHPVLGFDHFLAMVSVGILSAQMKGRAIWAVPATFVSVMAMGGMLGIAGIRILGVEFGIAVSVLGLGIALAAEKKLPPIAAMLFVGFLAIFHGHAHGTEMPSILKPALYALGFVVGTAGIHIVGVLIGFFATRTKKGAELLRYSGAGIAGIGAYILFAG